MVLLREGAQIFVPNICFYQRIEGKNGNIFTYLLFLVFDEALRAVVSIRRRMTFACLVSAIGSLVPTLFTSHPLYLCPCPPAP